MKRKGSRWLPDHYYLNVANQGKPVKVLKGEFKGKVGIYTGRVDSYYDGDIYVRIGATYIKLCSTWVELLPKGKLTGVLYGD